MKIEIYTELCCDYCNDIIHNHMDCPACGEKYAATDTYHDLYWDLDDEGPVIIECQKCKAEFKLISHEGYMDEWEWERV